ncbi:uncharacterized protein LOC120685459 isoform X5 [Panicum virgatum]|uniref:uncharacterized protein LOC120685459 isoform X5 n=1 Tax=Panicum virgatum TaxID=38727 RepID=UPI0019D60515|nr:uncharacterized protein LOC120685459 isoform X5 [Panicum virgatum]
MHCLIFTRCFSYLYHFVSTRLVLSPFCFLALGQPWIPSHIDGLLFPYTLESRLGDDGTEAPTALGLRLGGRGDPKKQEETSSRLYGTAALAQMADPLSIVDNIIQLVLAIKKAVETVRENKDECVDIQRRVLRIKILLSLLKKSEMMKHQAMSDALEDLGNALYRALEVVKACQARNILCRFCASGKQAKKLRQVRGYISETMMVAIFATNIVVYVESESHDSDGEPDPFSEHLPASPPLSIVVGEDRLSPSPAHAAPSTSINVVDVSDSDLSPHSPKQQLSPPPTVPPPALSEHLHSHLSTKQQQQQKRKHPSPPTSPPFSRHKPPYPPTKPPPSPPHPPPAKIAPLSNHIPPYPPTQPPLPPLCSSLSEHLPPHTPTQPPPPPPIKITSPSPPKHLPSHPTTQPPATPTPHPPTLKIGPTPFEYLHPQPKITKSLPPLPPPPPPPPPPLSPSPPLHPSIPSTTAPHLPSCLHHPHTSTHLPRHSPTQGTSKIFVPASISSALSTDNVRKHSHLLSGSDKSEEKYERKEAPARSSTASSRLPGLTKFSLSNLKAATHEFSNGKMIESNDCTVYEGELHDGVMVTIKKFRNPPRSLVARWNAKLHLASKLQSKDAEALGNNKYIIRVLGYGHEFLWGHESLEPHYFLVEEYLPNGNMGGVIYGISPRPTLPT